MVAALARERIGEIARATAMGHGKNTQPKLWRLSSSPRIERQATRVLVIHEILD